MSDLSNDNLRLLLTREILQKENLSLDKTLEIERQQQHLLNGQHEVLSESKLIKEQQKCKKSMKSKKISFIHLLER